MIILALSLTKNRELLGISGCPMWGCECIQDYMEISSFLILLYNEIEIYIKCLYWLDSLLVLWNGKKFPKYIFTESSWSSVLVMCIFVCPFFPTRANAFSSLQKEKGNNKKVIFLNCLSPFWHNKMSKQEHPINDKYRCRVLQFWRLANPRSRHWQIWCLIWVWWGSGSWFMESHHFIGSLHKRGNLL